MKKAGGDKKPEIQMKLKESFTHVMGIHVDDDTGTFDGDWESLLGSIVDDKTIKYEVPVD